MSESRLKVFIRGSLFSILGIGLAGVLNYFVRREMALGLTVEEFGALYGMIAVVGIGLTFSDLGLGKAATVLVAESPDNLNRSMTGIFLLKSCFSLLVMGGFFCFHRQIISTYMGSSGTFAAFVLLISILFFQSWESLLTAYWTGLKKFGLSNIIIVCRAGFLLISGMMLLNWHGFTGAAAAFAVTPALFAIAGLLLAWRIEGFRFDFHIGKALWSRLFKLGGGIAVAIALLNLMYNMDSVMLGKLKGETSVGYYNAALPIMQIVQLIMFLPQVLLPITVGIAAEGDYAKLRRIGRWAVLFTLILAPSAFIFFHFTGGWLIRILFSADYVQAAPAVTLLCCGMVFYTFANFIFQILLSMNAITYLVLVSCITAVANFLLNWTLIPEYDFSGASLATLLSYVIFAILSFGMLEWLVMKKLREKRNE